MNLLRRARGPLAATAIAASVVAAASAGVSASAAAPAAPRIIAGSPADPAAWPFIGALYLDPRGADFKEFLTCGATVIAPRAAITAAHCVVEERAKRYSLVVGRPNLADTSTGREIPIRATKVNPRYGPPGYRSDIAILLLSRDAGVPAATLPSVAQNEAATVLGAPLRVAGYGATSPGGSHVSKSLLTTAETVVEGSRCKKVYGAGYSTKTTICTQGAKLAPPREGHAGACYGDSGGPLVADTPAGPLLVGAVSGGGVRCGTTPDYYVRVAANLAFIKQAAGVVPPAP